MIYLKKKKELTPEKIELALANVKASFAVDDIHVTDAEIEVGRKMLKDEITLEEALKMVDEV